MIPKEYTIVKYVCERCKTEYDDFADIKVCELCEKDMCDNDECEEAQCNLCRKHICYDCSKVADNPNLDILCNPCFSKTDFKEWNPDDMINEK